MFRYASRSTATALLLAALTLSALADDRLGVVPAGRTGERAHRLGHLLRCLSILDLTEDQKAAIRTILEAGKPGLQADVESARAAREKLRTDSAGSAADPCVVGQDFLALEASLAKLRDDRQSLRDQVFATLPADLKAKLEGCLEASAATSTSGDETDSEP